MSEAGLQTQGGMEGQPVMPVRRLNNYVYCPRLFYFQWVENVFQESADTVAGSMTHRNVDAPSRLDGEKAKALAENLPEGAKLRSLRLESETLGIVGEMDLVEGGPDGAQIVDYKKGSARRNSEGEREAREPESIQVGAYALLLQEQSVKVSACACNTRFFECPLDGMRLAKLRAELQPILKEDEDQVLFISLGPSSGDASLIIEAIGLPYEVRSRVTII